MKRMLQAVALTQLALVLLIGTRIVQVAGVAPPAFSEPAAAGSAEALPPKPRRRPTNKAMVEAIIEKNLFDTERGQGIDESEIDVDGEDATPLPPPTNVRLNGVFFRGDEPMAIMTDTSDGTTQRHVREGDMLGDYQVGKIGTAGVQLLGSGGQEFAKCLRSWDCFPGRYSLRSPP